MSRDLRGQTNWIHNLFSEPTTLCTEALITLTKGFSAVLHSETPKVLTPSVSYSLFSSYCLLSAHINTNAQAHCKRYNQSITSLTQSVVSPSLCSHITKEIAFDLAEFAFYLLLISHSVYSCLYSLQLRTGRRLRKRIKLRRLFK